MIPKKIHYCWFGGNPLPDDILGYIESWKKYMPDYEIKQWDESNFDIDICQYTRQAYDAKKYAFVSDYARILAMYTEGGVYFDTDVEVLRDPTPLFENRKMVLGHEDSENVLAAFFAAEPGLKPFGDLLDAYNHKSFIKPNGSYDTLPNPVIVTEYMRKNGVQVDGEFHEFVLIDGHEASLVGGQKDFLAKKSDGGFDCTIYPVSVFSAYNIPYDRLEITDETYTVHHCNGSWQTAKDRFKPALKKFLLRTIGEKNFARLKKKFYKK